MTAARVASELGASRIIGVKREGPLEGRFVLTMVEATTGLEPV
jgi:hypothetical protein